MLKTLVAAVLLIAIAAPAANAAQWYDQCQLFKDRSFQGKMIILHDGDSVANFDDFEDFNDDASSLKNTGTCRLATWKDKRFRGGSRTLGVGENVYDLGDENDEISSAKCLCS